MCGVCGTDLQLVAGYYGFSGSPGHEFVAQVVACASAPQLIGQRVVCDINIAHHPANGGSCGGCVDGLHHCSERRVIGIKHYPGAMAEFLVAPVANLTVVPTALPTRVAVFCEPVAAAMEILAQLGPKFSSSEPALVIGAGRLGQLIARVLSAAGAPVDVVARHSRQKDLLRGVKSVTCFDTVENERAYRLVVEACGSPEGLEDAFRAVRPRGTIVLKSTYAPTARKPDVNFARMVVDEVTVMGSRCGDIAQAVEWLAQGRISVEELIDVELPLEEGAKAFALAAQPGTMKVLLQV